MSSAIILCTLGLLFIRSSAAQDCSKPGTSEEVAYCLGSELRNSDEAINRIYTSLMNSLPDSEKVKLRNEQRVWIKERDDVCMCDSKGKDREKWFREILKNYRKTVCVTRYTRQRTSELERMQSDISSDIKEKTQVSDNSQSLEETKRHDISEYRFYSENKLSGRWYFEVSVNAGKIAKTSPTALFIGCIDSRVDMAYGDLSQIRSMDISRPIKHFGFALDLEAGKLYIRENGVWTNGTPGSSAGIDLKTGHPYKVGMETTVLIKPLIEIGYLQFNLGTKKFNYYMPDGYLPFSENN